jgi:hypoxanthine phosphoribosyltransferase
LISEQEISERVAELGKTISEDYKDKNLTILGVLTGSIVLLADLIRQIDLQLRVGLVQASSYVGETTTSGDLSINDSLVPDLTGRDVLIIDDIFDTGNTMVGLYDRIRKFNPSSLQSAVLLWKTERTTVEMEPDYFGFKIPNEFVIGYGLDYNDEYRHIPYIGVLEESDLNGS